MASRTSAFPYRATDIDVRDIGAQRNVAHVLEGSVRRAGSRLRVPAQLVAAASGYQRWSERFDVEMTDVFDIQMAWCSLADCYGTWRVYGWTRRSENVALAGAAVERAMMLAPESAETKCGRGVVRSTCWRCGRTPCCRGRLVGTRTRCRWCVAYGPSHGRPST